MEVIIINNYKFLFVNNELESKKWISINLNKNNNNLSQKQILNYKLINLINNYTSDIKTNLKNIEKDNIDIKDTNRKLEIKLNDKNINVYRLSDIIRNQAITNDHKRRGKCHEKSIILSLNISKNNYLVTGYVSGLREKDKFLHSVVELKINNKKYILDYTLNAIINKDGYDYLMNFEELSRISRKDLLRDYQEYDKFKSLDSLSTKQYLVYRDEIINDLSRNERIFTKGVKK